MQSKSVTFTCLYFGISRDTYSRWKKNYQNRGQGLINSKPCPSSPKLRTPFFIEGKILYQRKNYHFRPQKISCDLARYHQIKIPLGGVYQVLKQNELNRLPQNERKRARPMVKLYEKQFPGYHQVDVKFLYLQDPRGKKLEGFNLLLLMTPLVFVHSNYM